ncbi:MAG: hypothetical protein IJ760_08505 [Bacteroidales bacterium]|nr:hypothetical protein [Bacteroidales bacterium]
MKKRHLHARRTCAVLLLALAATTLTGCHKACVCKSYNGQVYTYTPEQVDNHGGSCQDMVYQAGMRIHSICDWE